jgi:hypothetical protein
MWAELVVFRSLWAPPHLRAPASRSDIRLIQYSDSSALGLVALNWLFPYPLITPAPQLMSQHQLHRTVSDNITVREW